LAPAISGFDVLNHLVDANVARIWSSARNEPVAPAQTDRQDCGAQAFAIHGVIAVKDCRCGDGDDAASRFRRLTSDYTTIANRRWRGPRH